MNYSWEQFQTDAAKVAQETGYPLAVLLGQAALETGRSVGSAPGNNFFGIKGSGTAGTQSLATKEQGPNGLYSTTSNFAAYSKPEDSIRAYVDLIKRNYPQAWAKRDNPTEMIQAIKAGGYATDNQYVQKVMNTPEFQNFSKTSAKPADKVSAYDPKKNGIQTFQDKLPGEWKGIGQSKESGGLKSLFDGLFSGGLVSNAYADSGQGMKNYLPKPQQQYHTVMPGDTLSAIAQQYLGNANLYNQLKAPSGNPNLIYPGQKIALPPPPVSRKPVYVPPVNQPQQQQSQPSAQLSWQPQQQTAIDKYLATKPSVPFNQNPNIPQAVTSQTKPAANYNPSILPKGSLTGVGGWSTAGAVRL